MFLKKPKINQDQENKTVVERKPRRKLSKQNLTTLIGAILLVLAHVALLLAIVLSFRYYSIYPALFGSIVCIIVCLLLIIDFIFFVGFNHKDLAMKIVSAVLALFILVGGTVGTYYISVTNGIVNNVLGSGGSTKYETYSGTFVSYSKYQKYEKLEDLKGATVGLLNESSDGISYIARNKLKEAGVDVAEIDYNTNAELMTALIDNEVDAIVITSAYRNMYSLERDENSPFAQYLDTLNDFYSFEEQLKVKTDKVQKNLSKDPFNVLLIGYSRTDIGSSIGLADSIIVATVNPQTYTVSMMSIARDSFVPISCYGGEYDKINSGRATSRACFIETVEDFLDMDIDYYMELDYLGLVAIVNAIGGIYINNPVTFTLDGITVPQGEHVFADGQMALQFCRERHSMPNGDFDRQQHQKEVIMEIAKTLISSADINLALNAMDAASRWMSTDMTLSELTQVFNLLLNTKNYTGMDTFDLIDFQTLRMTGYGGILYYSYSMKLPLWVYLIYQGSYDESVEHIRNAMGNYKTISQDSSFEFSARTPYNRPLFYSLEYENKFLFEPDPMPAYWINFKGMSLSDARKWAEENNVELSVEIISPTSPDYNEEFENLIFDQEVRYGSLLTEYSKCKLIVMAPKEIDEDKQCPDFVGHSYSKAVKWARAHGVDYDIDFDTKVSGEVGNVVSQSVDPYTLIENIETLKIVVKAGKYTIKFDKNGHGLDKDVPSSFDVVTGDADVEFDSSYAMSSSNESGTKYVFAGWYKDSNCTGDKIVDTTMVTGKDGSTVTLYAKWVKEYIITLDASTNGGECSTSSITTSGTLPNASKSHYEFIGWYTSSDGGDKVTDVSTLTSATTLYARFTPAEWTDETTSNECDCDEQKDGQVFSGCTITYIGNDVKEGGCVCNYTDPPEPISEEPEQENNN